MANIYAAAQRHLAKNDPVMKDLIRRFGPCGLRQDNAGQPYRSLIRAIAHQQLHARAAEAILKRFFALYGDKFPQPEALLATETDQLRACGFSLSKIAALRDLAAHRLSGTVPGRAEAGRLSDDDLIARLVQIRGIGRWTVEMLLMFHLGRADILPVDDFGVRNGTRIAYGMDAMPKPKELAEIGLRWQPWRSVAAWYLWQAAAPGAIAAPSK